MDELDEMDLVEIRKEMLQRLIDQCLKMLENPELLEDSNFSFVLGMTKQGEDEEHYTHSFCLSGEGAVVADNIAKTFRKCLEIIKKGNPGIASMLLADLLDWKEETSGTVH